MRWCPLRIHVVSIRLKLEWVGGRAVWLRRPPVAARTGSLAMDRLLMVVAAALRFLM